MTRLAALAALLCLAQAGCAPKKDHPPPAANPCDGSSCVEPGPGGGGGAEGGVDAGGGDASADAPAGVSVSGSVVLLTGDDFATAAPFGESATVAFEAPGGLWVQGNYNGSSFALDGVVEGPGVWSIVTPKSSSGALPTLQPADTTKPPLELAVVPTTTIDTIYAFLSVPAQREPGAAHVVLRFLNAKTGFPVTGVTVSHQGEPVAYDTGGSWSDTAPGSGVAGYAVVANVASAKGPNKQSFKFTAPTASAGVYILVQPDSVTLADVLVD